MFFHLFTFSSFKKADVIRLFISMAESRQDFNTLQTATITPAPQATQKPSNRGLSTGAIVGITIGVTVFVVALVGIIVFILMGLMKRGTTDTRNPDTRSRSRSSGASHIRLGKQRSGSKVRPEPSVKAQKQSAVPEEERNVQFIDLDRDLPQPIPESEILQDWQKLSVSIKNHVTDCYHRDKAGQRNHAESSPLAYLESYQLSHPKSRQLAIRQCIGKFIVENINPAANPDDTFLPPKLVTIIRSMPIIADEKSPRRSFLHVTLLFRVLTCLQVLEAALARWRVITHFLLFPERHKVSTEYMINSDVITRAAEKLSNDLQPYLQPTQIVSKEECKASLEKTLRLGAMFGLKLFSQGARWSFGDWDVRERDTKKGRRSLVLLPAVLKMTDEYGHFLGDPLVLHEETCEDF